MCCSIRNFLLFASLFWASLAAAVTPVAEIERRFDGRAVEDIVFESEIDFPLVDLAQTIDLERGDRIEAGVLHAAVERLMRKEIFDHIDLDVREVSDGGVQLTFVLILRPRVSNLVFAGNEQLDVKELRRISRVRIGASLDSEVFSQAVERIKKRYREEGFYSAKVDVELVPRAVASETTAKFTIEEGYRSDISRVFVRGLLPDDVSGLAAKIRARGLNNAASERNFKTLQEELLAALRVEGYLQATVDSEWHYQLLSGDVHLTLSVNARDPMTFVFVGNRRFSDAELLEPLQLRTRRIPFTANAVRTLCRKIEELYQVHGYFFADATFRELPPQGARRVYEVKVVEGRESRLVEIEFSGNSGVATDVLRDLVETDTRGFWFLSRWWPGYLIKAQLLNDLDAIQAYYQQEGYQDPRANFKLDLTAFPARSYDELRLTIEIAEGTPPVEASSDESNTEVAQSSETRVGVAIGEVFFAGNYFTKNSVIERELAFQSGDAWSEESFEKSRQALYRTGLFRSVVIEPADGVIDSEREDIVVRVMERETGSVELGTGFDTQDGLQLLAQLSQRNLAGTGQTLTLGMDAFFKSGERVVDAGRARLVYERPHFLGQDTVLRAEGFGQFAIKLVEQFSYDRIGVSTELRYPIAEKLTAALKLQFYREDVFDVEPFAAIGRDDEGAVFYSIISHELSWDRRDDVYNPRKGWRTRLGLEYAGDGLGSEVSFIKGSISHTHFFPLSKRVVWANNISSAITEPLGDTRVVPITQRFFLGGRSSLRGFSRNAIGPRAVDGTVVGGDSFVHFNTEFAIDLGDNFGFLLFADVGQSFLENKEGFLENEGGFLGESNDFSNLRYSPGFGLTYGTPIGPVVAEYGIALDREFGERFGRFHLGIGGAF